MNRIPFRLGVATDGLPVLLDVSYPRTVFLRMSYENALRLCRNGVQNWDEERGLLFVDHYAEMYLSIFGRVSPRVAIVLGGEMRDDCVNLRLVGDDAIIGRAEDVIITYKEPYYNVGGLDFLLEGSENENFSDVGMDWASGRTLPVRSGSIQIAAWNES